MSKILKRTSFGLIRTNPKLTTNIKIVADSKNKIFLESIDANSYLTRSIYKGYEVSPNGSYSYDLARFYARSGGSLPESISYAIFEEDDSTVIKNRYKNQYDFTYGFGTLPKNSKLYTEEFGMFAPLWVERDNLPDYFVIFKMDGPVTVNSKEYRGSTSSNTDLDTDVILNSLTQDPEYFFKNIVQKSRVIKTFDLTNKSALGKYIRRHVEDPNFPDSPYYLALEKDENSYWNGISYKEGGFAKKGSDIYSEYTLTDKTIIESEDFITDGFKRNSIVCANILNLEFLFDDKDQEKYKFSRYFGLFVNEVELGKFFLSEKRLFNDKDNETNQIPRPTSDKVGNPLLDVDSIQSNVKGIKIYPEVGPTGPYSGRLLSFSELQKSRFGYVKDINNNFYSIDNVNNWSTLVTVPATGSTPSTYTNDTNFLRIKNQTINWKNFTGLDSPFAYIPSESSSYQGRPAIAFKVISRPNAGDEIRVQFTDSTNLNEAPYVNTHTVDSSAILSPGSNNGLTFSNQGTLKQISTSIVNAINQIPIYAGETQPFKAMIMDDEILVFSKIDSENWNKLKISFFTTAFTFPYSISNEYVEPINVNNYTPTPIQSSLPAIGRFLEVNFSGGSDNPKSRAIVERKYVQEFRDPLDEIYIKTKKGNQTTGDYSLYLDEPIKSDSGEIIGFSNYNKYYVINLKNNKDDIEFGSSKKLGLQKKSKNSNGYFSILPVKDFDFDFYNQDYKKLADSDREKLLTWYQSGTGGTGLVPSFNWTNIGPTGSTSQNEIIDILGSTSSFVVNGGFQSLIGYQNDLTDTNEDVFNEYDRLKENYLSELALSSRVVPFINKWVYDDSSKDVRDNDYRLNTDQSFGYSNFSPDFDQVERTPKFFTHEWYYLQKYPPYMSFQDKLNSFSYFDEDLYFPDLPFVGATGSTSVYTQLVGMTGASANLLSIDEDYFLSYFTRETVDGLSIPRDFKYSIFSGGTNNKASETLFRGIKVEVIDRSEYSFINYNKDSLRFLNNEKYNEYRFSCLLTYGNAGSQMFCIKNDKWKSITLVISTDMNDSLLKYVDNSTSKEYKFIDRIHLYTLQNKLSIRTSITLPPLNEFYYEDIPISGMINDWIDETTHFNVKLTTDLLGNAPILNSELTINENGGFNDIKITDNVQIYTFKGVTDVEGSSFKCSQIEGLPGLPNPLYPNNGTNSLNGIPGIKATWGPLSNTYDNPLSTNPIYIGGGYNAFKPILDNISFSSIQTYINVGAPEVRYISVDSLGNISENTFVINLVEPDYPVKSSYLERKILDKSPDEIQIPVSILGYELTSSDRLSLNQIARYTGNYSPRTKDIIQFVDTDDIKTQGLDYNNIQILDNLTYLKDSNLGKIKNLFYNKVNVENPKGVLYAFVNGDFESNFRIYPLLGEVAIDKDDFYIFKSNWDSSYYHKNLLSDARQYIIGTREPKEEKSFFGSKAISIPNEVRIETFPLGISTIQDLKNAGSIEYVQGSIITEEKVFATKKEININVYTSKSLVEWLIIDGFASEFTKYVDSEYSFGNPGIDDDARLYIKENIFDRYSIKQVLMWEKVYLPEKGVTFPDQIVTNLTDAEKSLQGYTLSKNFNFIQDGIGGLDFKVIYTVPKDKRTSICFTVVLEKK
jgi:hypothetical protein